MKKQNLTWLFLVALLTCGLWGLAAEEKAEPRPQRVPVRQPRLGEPARPRSRVSMTDPNTSDRFPAGAGRPALQPQSQTPPQDPFLLQVKDHEELIGALAEIKKIAEEEGASRTAEAIQKLMDKKNEEHKKSAEALQKRQMEMQRRIEERMSRRQQQTGTARSAEEKTKEQSAEKQAENQSTAGNKGTQK